MTWPSEVPLIPCHRAAAFFLLPDANDPGNIFHVNQNIKPASKPSS